jgi:putative Mn2+ efflux pump MntP
MHPLISVINFSFDSFLAGVAMGSWVPSWRPKFGLALAFGACDAAATLAGSVWRHRLPGPPALVIYLLCAFLFVWAVRSNRALLYLLPVLFSVDNFFGGNPASMAPALGFGSAVMVLFGLIVAAAWQHVFFEVPAEV